MKKIRRIRITVKTSELLIVKNGINRIDDGEQNVCPVCHSPINVKSQLTADSAARLLAENKLTDELPNTKILNEKKI